MSARDINITALWTPNNYTVTFDTNGGDELQNPIKTVTFNRNYGDLPTPIKTNFTFLGWFTAENEKIQDDAVVAISTDHTLIAQWKKTPTNYVEIVFSRKRLDQGGDRGRNEAVHKRRVHNPGD